MIGLQLNRVGNYKLYLLIFLKNNQLVNLLNNYMLIENHICIVIFL